MNIDELTALVKKHDEGRFNHVFSTYKKALYLAERYGADKEKCAVAALLHDYAKHLPLKTIEDILRKTEPDLLRYDPVIYHGPAGAYLIQRDLNITDPDIVDAVKYHTTGKPGMNPISQIIFISDCIEDLRTQEGVDVCRLLADKSLDLGVLGCAKGTLDYLIQTNNRNIHPLTKSTYEYYLMKAGKEYDDFVRNHCKSR